MKIEFNPYARKNPAGEYSSYFNLLYHYVETFGSQPNVYEFSCHILGSSVEALEGSGAERLFLCESERIFEGKSVVSPLEMCYRLGDVLVHFSRKESIFSRIEYMTDSDEGDDEDEDGLEPDDDSDMLRCRVLYESREGLERALSFLNRAPERRRKGNVHLLCSMDNMLMLQRFEVKLPSEEIDLSLNYGDEIVAKFDKMVEALSSNKNGLVLLSGDPGTGKSTFIKHLTTQTTRKVIYLSSGAAEHITSPDFLSFMMRNRNCVLLLEDAEKVLRSREEQDNTAISNILNITDGILGDCLNILVVATFNIDRDKIDSALVRKGRLLVEHHFKALSPEDANKVLEKSGSDRRTSEPMTLAEIYNPDDNYHEEPEQKKKVGF